MKISIVSIKNLTSKSGTPFGIATVKNESNAVFENTTIFGSFPGYAELKEGSVIEGELVANDYNGKTGWKINAPRVGGAAKSGNMAATMEKKEKSIGAAMDRKENSIEKMAVFRDSTLLTVAYINKLPMEDVSEAAIKEVWMKWRAWLESQLGEVPF